MQNNLLWVILLISADLVFKARLLALEHKLYFISLPLRYKCHTKDLQFFPNILIGAIIINSNTN